MVHMRFEPPPSPVASPYGGGRQNAWPYKVPHLKKSQHATELEILRGLVCSFVLVCG